MKAPHRCPCHCDLVKLGPTGLHQAWDKWRVIHPTWRGSYPTSDTSWYMDIHGDVSCYFISWYSICSWYIMIHHDTSWYIMIHLQSLLPHFSRDPEASWSVTWATSSSTIYDHRFRVVRRNHSESQAPWEMLSLKGLNSAKICELRRHSTLSPKFWT